MGGAPGRYQEGARKMGDNAPPPPKKCGDDPPPQPVQCREEHNRDDSPINPGHGSILSPTYFCAQPPRQRLRDTAHRGIDLLRGEGALAGAEREGIGEVVVARGHRRGGVHIEQLYRSQQAPARLGDEALNLRRGDIVGGDGREITPHGGETWEGGKTWGENRSPAAKPPGQVSKV